MKLFMGLCFLPVLFIIYFSMIYSAKNKPNFLFGVSCVNDYFTKNELNGYFKTYKRELNIWLLILTLLFCALFLIPKDYIFISVLLLWLLPAMFCFFIPYIRGFLAVSKEKQARLGEISEAAMATPVDLNAVGVTYQTGLMKYGWIGTLLGCVPVILATPVPMDTDSRIVYDLMFISLVLINGLFLFLMYWLENRSTKVISSKTEENIAYTKIEVCEWSKLLNQLIWLTSIYSICLFGVLIYEDLFWGLILSSILYCVLLCYCMIRSLLRIRDQQNHFQVSAPYSVDDDRYWILGMFYYNKNDSHFMVSRRDGLGFTINFAKTSGKFLSIVMLIIILGSTIGCSIWVLMEGIYRPTITLEQNNVVATHISQEYEIPIASIEEVSLLDALPKARKDIGSAMDELYKGKFRISGMGRCNVLLNPTTHAYIVIETTDGTCYILNEDSMSDTLSIYYELEEMVE